MPSTSLCSCRRSVHLPVSHHLRTSLSHRRTTYLLLLLLLFLHMSLPPHGHQVPRSEQANVYPVVRVEREFLGLMRIFGRQIEQRIAGRVLALGKRDQQVAPFVSREGEGGNPRLQITFHQSLVPWGVQNMIWGYPRNCSRCSDLLFETIPYGLPLDIHGVGIEMVVGIELPLRNDPCMAVQRIRMLGILPQKCSYPS